MTRFAIKPYISLPLPPPAPDMHQSIEHGGAAQPARSPSDAAQLSQVEANPVNVSPMCDSFGSNQRDDGLHPLVHCHFATLVDQPDRQPDVRGRRQLYVRGFD